MKRGLKNSQVTVFIIIAILIVVLVILGVYFFNLGGESELDGEYFQSSEIKAQVSVIENSIVDCLDSVSKEALGVIGLQGGYYENPDLAMEVEDLFIPYYYYEGVIKNPSLEDIKKQLSYYYKENLGNCIDGINYGNFRISYRDLEVGVLINFSKVDFVVNSNLKIIKDKKHVLIDLSEYPVSLESPLYDIIEVADYITDSHEQDSSMYCASCLGEILEEKNLYIDMISFADNSVLIVISDKAENGYIFEFANKYTGKEEGPPEVIEMDLSEWEVEDGE